ncbi:MAG TPA: hypothetical protein VFN65_08990 [Solirubrobacteraceae bacterium]|nr:hypothetical protein [Solirubrobacteraceae bacterium]
MPPAPFAARRVHLPWLNANDRKMLDNLDPEARRQMSNLIHEQARSEERNQKAVKAWRSELEPGTRRREASGEHIALPEGNDDADGVPPHPPAQPISALLAAAAGRPFDDARMGLAARLVMDYWDDQDPRVRRLLKELDAQQRQGLSSLSLEEAARSAGIAPSTARERIEKVYLGVIGALVDAEELLEAATAGARGQINLR